MMAYTQDYVVSVIDNTGKPLREFNEGGRRTCRVPFDTEYKLRLKNKNFGRAKAKITIDGMDVFTGGRSMIVGPGETVDLERFVDSLSEGRKFKFMSVEKGKSTGEIQDPDSPQNGLIRVEFHPEKYVIKAPSWSASSTQIFRNSNPFLRSKGFSGQSVGDDSHHFMDGNTVFNSKSSLDTTRIGDSVDFTTTADVQVNDIGATAEGGHSDQKFTVGEDFDTTSPVVMELWLKGPTADYPVMWTAHLECGNCGVRRDLDLSKGVVLNNVIRNVECTNCGCFALRRR